MALFDKVKNWVSKNPDKAGQAIEKAGDLFDKQTKGKYAAQVDKAQNAARGYVDKNGVDKNKPDGPGVNPQNPPLHP
ncbi:antitoxin [Mycobacterium sp. WMMD1722]|uniref:antitoxin n=1 Tax=Mycobacterium sp. WMMD1722 TaxID=3404117 RepID=UPI003BF59C69